MRNQVCAGTALHGIFRRTGGRSGPRSPMQPPQGLFQFKRWRKSPPPAPHTCLLRHSSKPGEVRGAVPWRRRHPDYVACLAIR